MNARGISRVIGDKRLARDVLEFVRQREPTPQPRPAEQPVPAEQPLRAEQPVGIAAG